MTNNKYHFSGGLGLWATVLGGALVLAAPVNAAVPELISYAGGTSELYVVYIPGDNRSTLARVRQIEPDAFINEYEGRMFIQVGAFADKSNAQRRSRELERLVGVRSAIDKIDFTAERNNIAATPPPPPPPSYSDDFLPPPPVNFEPLPEPVGDIPLPKGYFAIVPGKPENLSSLAQQAVEAGIEESKIFTRSAPFGPHLAIGPYPDRTTAEQESNYLRLFGLNARVEYQ
ncbi:MAG: hypothetical protein Fur0025_40280 [Oscillatoriaceae cyanobacterium]